MRLPDNRILGFAQYGAPSGKPLLVFHGFPSSRLECLLMDQLARRHNIRIVAPDRPGFGLSTFHPHARVTTWPADILSLVQHLDIDSFAALGVSGGAPYALACGKMLPRDRLTSLGIAAGAPYWAESGFQDMPWFSWCLYLPAKYWPWSVRALTDAVIKVSAWAVQTPWLSRRLDRALDTSKIPSELGLEYTDNAAWKERVLRMSFESFAQGSAAFVQETQLLTSHWGFALAEVDFQPIHMWHGNKDVNAPTQAARYMAQNLVACDYHEFDGTHGDVAKHFEDILVTLVPPDQA